MIQITEEDLADLIAEGIEIALDELHGKGSLEKIAAHHGKEGRIADKHWKAIDDEGEEDSDRAMHAGNKAAHHHSTRDRAHTLMKVRNTLGQLKKAKAYHAANKKEADDARWNKTYDPD